MDPLVQNTQNPANQNGQPQQNTQSPLQHNAQEEGTKGDDLQHTLQGSGALNLGGNINSLYGGFSYEENTSNHETLQPEAPIQQEVLETRNPEKPKSVETSVTQKEQPNRTDNQVVDLAPPTKVNDPKLHVEDKTTEKVKIHTLEKAPDPVTRFADKDEEDYITGIVEHHEHK